jgi:hypothetical protein
LNVLKAIRIQDRRIADVASAFWAMSLEGRGRKFHYFPVRVFVHGKTPSIEIRKLILDGIWSLCTRLELDFDYYIEVADEESSWYKELILKLRQIFTHKQVTQRFEKVEDALESQYLSKPQAEANMHQAQGAAALIDALKTTDEAWIQAGSLLMIKTKRPDGKSCVQARTLSLKQMRAIEEDRNILRDPERIKCFLEHL